MHRNSNEMAKVLMAAGFDEDRPTYDPHIESRLFSKSMRDGYCMAIIKETEKIVKEEFIISRPIGYKRPMDVTEITYMKTKDGLVPIQVVVNEKLSIIRPKS
jgi:hypothetical protein